MCLSKIVAGVLCSNADPITAIQSFRRFVDDDLWNDMDDVHDAATTLAIIDGILAGVMPHLVEFLSRHDR